MVSVLIDKSPKPAPIQAHSQTHSAFINHLRFVAMECRVKRKTNLFEACALLHANRNASAEAHSEALIRCLSEALGKTARLLAPGTPETTFDEQWLIQAGMACARQDNASLTFLLGSRVRREHHRLMGYLLAQISDAFAHP